MCTCECGCTYITVSLRMCVCVCMSIIVRYANCSCCLLLKHVRHILVINQQRDAYAPCNSSSRSSGSTSSKNDCVQRAAAPAMVINAMECGLLRQQQLQQQQQQQLNICCSWTNACRIVWQVGFELCRNLHIYQAATKSHYLVDTPQKKGPTIVLQSSPAQPPPRCVTCVKCGCSSSGSNRRQT